MNVFWWDNSGSTNNGKRGVRWLSWKRLCVRKNNGGLGFRYLRDFNLTLLCKQAWRLIQFLNSLASKIFKARYFPNNYFRNPNLGSTQVLFGEVSWQVSLC